MSNITPKFWKNEKVRIDWRLFQQRCKHTGALRDTLRCSALGWLGEAEGVVLADERALAVAVSGWDMLRLR